MTDTSLLASTLASGRDAVTLDAALIAKATQLVGDFAVNLTLAILILIATIIASRWASSAARKGLGRINAFRRDSTVLTFAVQVVRVAVLIMGLIAVLQRLGVQTTSIIAVLGAASLAVGLALQGTLSNVAAGVMLLILRPYRVGDVVDIGGVTASVQKLDLFTTQLSNASNHKIVVPNSLVLGDRILNFSGQTRRRVEIDFTVGYGEDLKQAREVLEAVGRRHDAVLEDPPVWSGVTGLLDSAVQVTLHAWVNSGDWWQTQADLMQAGKEALDEAGIEIPFPHQVEVPHKGADLARLVMVTADKADDREGKS